MTETPVRFESFDVDTRNGVRRAIAVLPTATISYGADRLSQLRRGEWWTAIDHAIIHAVRSDARPIHAILLCARGPSPDLQWKFDDELSDEDAARIAALLLRSHAMICRELAPQGLYSVFVVDLAERELAAYRRGAEIVGDQIEEEMRRADPAVRPSLRLDQWLVERQTIWSTLPYPEFVADKLPGLLTTGERQYRQLRRMVGRLVTRPF